MAAWTEQGGLEEQRRTLRIATGRPWQEDGADLDIPDEIEADPPRILRLPEGLVDLRFDSANETVDQDVVLHGGYRSTSPNTMSSEPRMAETSASMWPRVIQSMPARCAKPGARILHR
jgi:hypothetical protein